MAGNRNCGGGFGDAVSCIPGCPPIGQQCTDGSSYHYGCSYPPGKLRDALQVQVRIGLPSHNEVIVDTRSVEQALPASILAFFYEVGAADHGAAARLVRSHFLSTYGLEADAAPLLRMDLGAAPGRAFQPG
jgi:hypothetical protein